MLGIVAELGGKYYLLSYEMHLGTASLEISKEVYEELKDKTIDDFKSDDRFD